MPSFKGRTIDGQPSAVWPKIYAACAKHDRFIVDIRKYDESAEISIQQMKYWHSTPVKLYAEHTGNSTWLSEQWLKRECGEQWFMQEVKEEESRRGRIMFECMNVHCRHLFTIPRRSGVTSEYVCPLCERHTIRMFFMLSKTELKVNDFIQVLQNTWDFMESINCRCPPPDPNWRINKQMKQRIKEINCV
jgi:hypothetical protein